MIRALLVLLSVLALVSAPRLATAHTSDADLDLPPSGLRPATVHLSAILALHDKSAPTVTHDTVVEDWAFTDTGVQGTEHLERSGTDYHSTIAAGTQSEQFGQLNGKRWHRNRNGITSQTTDIDDKTFLAVRVREDAADAKNDVSVVGETSDAQPAYVVKVQRPGYRHPEWIYYDEHTGNITRVDYVSNRWRVEETYDDFHTVDGVTQAWHMHDHYSDATLDDDWRVTAFHAGHPIPKAAFAAPPSQPTINGVAAREKLAGGFADGYAIVRVTIGDRGLDFELDSSSPNSIIDFDVARDLELPTFGHATHLSSGKALSYDTLIPQAHIGSMTLKNFAVTASHIAYNPNSSTRVVGVLGADFLANVVMHVDYVHELIEVFPPSLFDGKHPVENQIDLPLKLDDGIPLVPMIIGDGFTEDVVVNCDLSTTLVFGPYLDKHAEQFQDLEANKHRQSDVPFADEGTFGQKAEVWWSRTPTLRFAIANYQQLPVLTTNFPYSLSGRNVDAMLGLDLLHFFDLYFDFPHQRFLIVPNTWFHEAFKKA